MLCAQCWRDFAKSPPTARSAPPRSRRIRQHELDSSIDNATVREGIRRNMDAFGIPPEAVAEAIAFAVDQPSSVEIGEITVRPTVQN